MSRKKGVIPIPSNNALNYSPFSFIFKFCSGQETLCLAPARPAVSFWSQKLNLNKTED